MHLKFSLRASYLQTKALCWFWEQSQHTHTKHFASKYLKFMQQNAAVVMLVLQGECACSHSNFSGEVASENRANVYLKHRHAKRTGVIFL